MIPQTAIIPQTIAAGLVDLSLAIISADSSSQDRPAKSYPSVSSYEGA
jgi:hypothetical protein